MRPKTTTSEDRSEERARTGARRSRGMNKSTISGRTVVITGAASGTAGLWHNGFRRTAVPSQSPTSTRRA